MGERWSTNNVAPYEEQKLKEIKKQKKNKKIAKHSQEMINVRANRLRELGYNLHP